MNLTNLDTLIATVEAAKEAGQFDITRWTHDCGSPACIAGYAHHLIGDSADAFKVTWGEPFFFFPDRLGQYLEIDREAALEISTGFEGVPYFDFGRNPPTPDQALTFLRTMRETQEVPVWADLTPAIETTKGVLQNPVGYLEGYLEEKRAKGDGEE